MQRRKDGNGAVLSAARLLQQRDQDLQELPGLPAVGLNAREENGGDPQGIVAKLVDVPHEEAVGAVLAGVAVIGGELVLVG